MVTSYKRSITRNMVSVLMWVYFYTENKEPRNGWIKLGDHAGAFKNRTAFSDFTKLRFWGLIEQHIGGIRGIWRISDNGRAFCRGEFKVPAYLVLESPGCAIIGKSEVEITISDVLGDYGLGD